MKSLLNKTKNLFLIAISIFCLGCFNNDPCESVYCQNGGTCVNGYCNCPDGYEGENCEKQTGYDCVSGTCKYVSHYSISPDYKTYQACYNSCASSQSGYDCINGNCTQTNFLPTYNTLTACQNACGATNCFSTPYYGTQNCSSGYVSVGSGCCPVNYPYLGVQTDRCYTSCIAAKNAGNSSIIYGTGQTNGGGGTGGGGTGVGKVRFYQICPSSEKITITVDGLWTTYVNGCVPSSWTVDCDASSSVLTLSVGNHNFTAVSGTGAKWGPATFYISDGGCFIWKLR